MSFLIVLFVYVSASPSLLVLTSVETPSSLLLLLSPDQIPLWLPSDLRITILSGADLQVIGSAGRTAIAVVDATFSSGGKQTAAGVCAEYQIPLIALSYTWQSTDHPWSYSLAPTYQQLATALAGVCSHFAWKRVTFAVDDSETGRNVAFAAQSQSSVQSDVISFYLEDTNSVDRVVGRSVRTMGNRVTVIVTRPEITRKIEDAQRRKQIAGVGFANVALLGSVLGYGSFEGNGDLVLAEEGVAGVWTEPEFYQRLLRIAGSLASNCTDSQAVLQRLQARYPRHYPSPAFTLFNLNSGLRIPVGKVYDGEMTVNSTVFFLGNSSIVPANLKSPLQISGNFGIRNANSIVLAPVNYYRGALLAVEQVNSRPDVLSNFEIELFNFTAGVQVWNYDFAYQNVYPFRDRLGLALLTSTSSALTIKLYQFLKDLNYSGAVVGASNTVDALSSRSDYPSFLRTILPDKFLTKVYIEMFKRFSWQKCALFVSNEIWGLSFRSEFTRLTEENHISILNNSTLQVLPTPIPSLDTLRNYTANFQDFLDSRAKILVIVVNNNAVLVVDYLYELGVRAGEVQIVANEWLSLSFISTNDTGVNKRRSEILRGAIQFSPLGFVGVIGEKVTEDFLLQYAVTPPLYACFYYDAVLTVSYALDLIIRQGSDYLDPHILQKALRSEKFKGCTGTVVFDSDTNDRSLMQYNVLNAQFGANSSLVTAIAPVGVYDPTSTVLFHFYADIIWCDGSTTVPPDLRLSSVGCPFEDKYDKDFPEGRKLVYGLAAGFFGFVTVLVLAVWGKWWRGTVKVLDEEREIQLLDVIVYLGIIVETLQFISMGPIVPFLPSALTLILEGSSMSVPTVISYKNGGFGIVWLTAFVLFLIWLLMITIICFRLDHVCRRIPGLPVLGDISEALVPLFSDFLFLPILAVMTSVFICVKGVTQDVVDYSNSYLEADCFVPCWRGTHALYAIAAGIVLGVYSPICVFFRPIWQEMQQHINVKATGGHLMVKSIAQVAVVVLNKSLRERFPLLHACVFLAVIAAFLTFSLWKKAFCYARPVFWHRLSLVAVLWVAALSLVRQTAAVDAVVLVSLTVVGWVAVALSGYLYQKFRIPSLLYSKPGVDLNWLFRFAFKPTTIDIMNALKDNFQKVGHRNNVVVPEGTITTDRKDVTSSEEQASSPKSSTNHPKLDDLD